MSWDISIMNLPRDASSVADIPDDFESAPLGSRLDLIAKIRELAPQVDFSDPTWGQIATPEYVIEFNMGREEIVNSIMLHVRGGTSVIEFITQLLNHLDLRAVDCSEGDFFSPSTATESFDAWRDYRDLVTGDQWSV